MTKALVSTMNSRERQKSYCYKFFGDPDDYAYKLENDTFKDQLPIHMNWIYFSNSYDFLHSMSIVYKTQQIYFGNNLHQRLEYGRFVYQNETSSWFLTVLPETNQVTTVSTLYWRKQLLIYYYISRESCKTRNV